LIDGRTSKIKVHLSLCLPYYVCAGTVAVTFSSALYWDNTAFFEDCGLYYKSKLQLKSNSSEIFPVNSKFIFDSTTIKLTKLKLKVRKSDF